MHSRKVTPGMAFIVVAISVGMAFVVSPGSSQQPSPLPDCQAQLAMAIQRAGAQQALAAQDREAVILYFQAELRKYMQERDDARSKLENGAKPPEKEKP